MILKLYRYGEESCDGFLQRLSERAQAADPEILSAVSKIVEDVRKNGDDALFAYTLEFDRVKLHAHTVELSPEQLRKEAGKTPPRLSAAMERAACNIRAFHEKQKRASFIDTENAGRITGQRVSPLRRAGIYVPGGSASYPSSVLMNAIPAKVAGVSELVMTTPLRGGSIPPAVAQAALTAGVDRVFCVGGAQAIAALAYGTESVPRVDMIAGPGNIYVATAKRLVYGAVNIDMIAGPSEVLIIADKDANAAFIAADLLSQAEHDTLASAILLTDCEKLAARVSNALEERLQTLERKEIARQSLTRFGGVILCDSIDQAARLSNRLAPEHLELQVARPLSLFGKIENAGSVFLGEYSPESLGDYYAGPNHVLPTNGTARFFSALSVDHFIKKSGFIYYDKQGLRECREDLIRFADAEELTAHADAVKVRFEEE